MPLKLPVANEAASVESNVVKLEKNEENPVTEDIAMKRSHSPGGYCFILQLIYSSNVLSRPYVKNR